MPQVVDYASLTQAIADFTHRAQIVNFSDYFIAAAQEAIESDIADLNMGNGIAYQEASYGPFPIVNGVAPVPIDYLSPKLIYLADGIGDQFTLEFRSAAWVYDRYALRNNGGIPAYIARDVWQSSFSVPLTFACVQGQTSFQLGATPSTASLLVVSLDGAMLFPTVDFNVMGSTLTLTNGTAAGQELAVNFLSTSSGNQQWTAVAGQTSFALNNPSAAIILATLDGAVLSAGTDYNISSGFLTLNVPTLAGQTLLVYYAIGSVFIFGPPPDGAYSVAGTYYARAPVLSASSVVTSNWMTNSAPNLFLAACLVEAYKFLKNAEQIQTWSGIYQQRLKALVDRDKAERWSAGTMAVELG